MKVPFNFPKKMSGLLHIERILILFALGFLATNLFDYYQGQKMRPLLDEKEPGVYAIYVNRVVADERIFRQYIKSQQENTPGSHRSVLSEWMEAGTSFQPTYGSKNVPKWLADILDQERNEVLKIIGKLDVSVDDLRSIYRKLGDITPELTSEEKSKINKVEQPHVINDLSLVRVETARKIVEKLHQLDYSESALKAAGIVFPEELKRR